MLSISAAIHTLDAVARAAVIILSTHLAPGIFDAIPYEIPSSVDPMDPLSSSQYMDALFDDIPDGYIVDTCIMESGCRGPIGVHRIDAWAGNIVYAKKKKHGRIGECRLFSEPKSIRSMTRWVERWSTVGNHGLMFGHNYRHLGACMPMSIFEVPFLSALAAARKAQELCSKLRAKDVECTSENLRARWTQSYSAAKKKATIAMWQSRVSAYKSRRTSIDWTHTPSLEGMQEPRWDTREPWTCNERRTKK